MSTSCAEVRASPRSFIVDAPYFLISGFCMIGGGSVSQLRFAVRARLPVLLVSLRLDGSEWEDWVGEQAEAKAVKRRGAVLGDGGTVLAGGVALVDIPVILRVLFGE